MKDIKSNEEDRQTNKQTNNPTNKQTNKQKVNMYALKQTNENRWKIHHEVVHNIYMN